ncbi:uncharacterized protein LOC124266560 [Haliotis rubra]|uniref:uncharacterized protein LOC124266560 n=1 Tax=Haliotis rubra TaxID=36100 RepID=UPI001EE5584F|nr:uncharacterized protein LOC124266560 [Haliotis rubra]
MNRCRVTHTTTTRKWSGDSLSIHGVVIVIMAAAKILTDNHLTCVICTEVFTDPATLQCNHTFCKSCLLKYTNTQPEAIQAKSIPCPSCRQLTKGATPDSPVEEWVSQLKPSHVIQGLMDDFGPGSKAAHVNICSVCKVQGKTTPAISWCSVCDDVFCDGCLKMHNVMTMLRDHEVVDVSDTTKRKAKQRFMCKIHKDEQIKLFCKDCGMAICHTCCSIKHRKCDDVDTLDNMTPVVREHLSNQKHELKMKMTTSENKIMFRKSQIEEIESNAQSIKDEIRQLRKKVVEVILRKEKQLLDKVDRSSDKQLQELKAEIKSQEIELQMYQQQYEFTANAVSSNSEMDMYAVYESVGESTDNRDRDNQPAPGRVVFTHDMDKLSKAVDELQLGEVDVVGGVSDHQSTPVLHHTIDCQADDNDIGEPELFDVTVLTVDGIKVTVVADNNNNSIKTYQTSKSNTLSNRLLLSYSPYQIAKLSERRIAVSVPGSQEIVTVDVTPDPVLLSTIKTTKSYFALACLSPSQLVAGTNRQSHSVDILDMTGKILKSINTGVIKNPNYIHVTSNNNLIVSEASVKSLVSVTSEGEAVFTYTPTRDRALMYQRGITTTSTGDILLVDRDSHKGDSADSVRAVCQRCPHTAGWVGDQEKCLCVRKMSVFEAFVDMTGRILKSINTGAIENPDCIHVTRNNNLIVSEGKVKSLVSVTSEGEAVFTYTPPGDRALKRPWGITTTSTGDILLVDRDSHKVIQLTESGQFVRDVLTQQDGLEYPCGICLDGDGFVYVTCGRYVKVFKLKK